MMGFDWLKRHERERYVQTVTVQVGWISEYHPSNHADECVTYADLLLPLCPLTPAPIPTPVPNPVPSLSLSIGLPNFRNLSVIHIISSPSILAHDRLAVLRRLLCLRIVDIVVVEDFAVHHDLPSVDGKVCVIERPVEFHFRNGFVGGVMVRGEVFVRETLTGGNSFARVED